MQPNSLLTDKSIDALVRVRELSPEPIRDAAIIESALTAYVMQLEMLLRLDAQIAELRRLTAQYDAQRKAMFSE